jgi:hypothetical protein
VTEQLYTASRLRVLRECPRKHLYRYVLGLRSAETADMRFGTVGHAALEAWYRSWKAGDLDGRLPAALAVVETAYLPDAPFEAAKLRLLVIAYHERWGGEDWEIVDVEVEFRYRLGDHLIGGKIDALIRTRGDGRVYVVEHKFTGTDTTLGGPYWERLALDTQVSIYIDGAAMLGHEIAGCVYDVIKRPGHSPLLATAPDKRKYTVGKGCKGCGGSAKPGAIAQGRGTYTVAFPGEPDRVIACEGCDGTGWKKDKDGVPEAPRLHADQREHDETAEQFEERLLDVLAERPDDFLQRCPIVRLDHELPQMRVDLIEWIQVEQLGLAPRNDSACVRAGRICEFFDACTGRVSVDDLSRGAIHPELAAQP